MPAELIGAEIDRQGCLVHYVHAGAPRTLEARVLVNAAGPWAARVLARVRPSIAVRAVDLIQGTHLVVTGTVTMGIYYLEVPRDGRGVFAMPWKGNLLLGTTETRYRGDPDHVRPLRAERDYLLAVLARYFPARAAAGPDGVLDAFAGLRVLPAARGHAFHRSRETLLDVDGLHRVPRVVTIYGGKLTAFRATAATVMARAAPSLPARRQAAATDRIRLLPP
jgi:glycerol-3-phosphate dehydrogenase